MICRAPGWAPTNKASGSVSYGEAGKNDGADVLVPDSLQIGKGYLVLPCVAHAAVEVALASMSGRTWTRSART